MDDSFTPQPTQPKIESYNLVFEKKQHGENVVLYLFNHVIVAIDTSGKNYKELPEILFGTFDKEYSADSLRQSHQKTDINIDMSYVSACIKEVVRDSGINKFWLYPFGDDSPENKERREVARLRLFKRYVNLTPEPNGFGYVMEV